VVLPSRRYLACQRARSTQDGDPEPFLLPRIVGHSRAGDFRGFERVVATSVRVQRRVRHKPAAKRRARPYPFNRQISKFNAVASVTQSR
jgi:hypothetical protein